jgi:hypothetical protein
MRLINNTGDIFVFIQISCYFENTDYETQLDIKRSACVHHIVNYASLAEVNILDIEVDRCTLNACGLLLLLLDELPFHHNLFPK